MKIASAEHIAEDHAFSAVSLLFAPDGRPSVEEVSQLAHETGHFSISHNPAAIHAGSPEEHGEVWLELLAMGLTFDLRGLAPGNSRALPDAVHRYGLDASFTPENYAVVTLTPGPHLAAGGLMLPVIRCLAWVAAVLTRLPGVVAVAWHPARSFSEPNYFRDSVMRWIDGGAFPGLGLTALSPTPEGGLHSEGLALFTGQELKLCAGLVADKAEGAKIALRLLHWMVEHGTVTEPQLLTGPSGEALRVEPAPAGDVVKVLRNSH